MKNFKFYEFIYRKSRFSMKSSRRCLSENVSRKHTKSPETEKDLDLKSPLGFKLDYGNQKLNTLKLMLIKRQESKINLHSR